MKLEFSRQIFEKYVNIKFHENPSSGNQVVTCGRTDEQTGRQTDRHDEANSRFSQFCERAKKLKKHGTGLPSYAHTKVSAKIGQLFQKSKGEKRKHARARTHAHIHNSMMMT
jgi:hypothetical protein